MEKKEIMQKRVALGFAAALVGSLTIIPAGVQAAAPPLPTCTGSLAAAVTAIVPHTLPGTIAQGIPAGARTVAVSFTSIVPGAVEKAATPPGQPTPIGSTPAYCQVAFVYSPNTGGPPNGYAAGQMPQIQVEIILPLSKADGGSDVAGVEGNWNGGVLVSGSAGSSGSLGGTAFEDGLNAAGGPVNGYDYAIRLGYVGSSTDTGQIAANAAHSFVINSNVGPPNPLVTGTIADWAYRGTYYGKQWADAIAKVYYGKAPKRHYYNGASGGGNMGMGQLMHYGNEYDGFLIGGPAFYWSQFTLADVWPNLVFRKLVQLDGASALPTAAQATALYQSVVAACDVIPGLDTVADGIISDPRWCSFSATANICNLPGAPAAPNCLTADQAASFDRIWDGPRNSHGARIWYGWGKSVPIGTSLGFPFAPAISTSASSSIVTWDHLNAAWPANNCLFVDKESAALGTTNSGAPLAAGNQWAACASPGTPITYEDEATLDANVVADYTDNQTTNLTKALDHGAKVIHLDGNADGAIYWLNGPAFYNHVAKALYGGTTAADYKKLQSWYRFFTEPGVGHVTGALGGGVGPSVYDPFLALRNWVEHDIVPKSIPALSGNTTNVAGYSLEPGRTRRVCPYPQTYIYSGFGSTDDINSFTCGGNVQTLAVACNDVRTVYKQENTANLDFKGVGLTAIECAAHLPPPNAGTPSSP
jgi:Tannase and feruloyl esterase